MKTTKLTMILFAAAQVAASNIVSAQDSPTPTPTPEPMLPQAPPSNSLGKPSISDLLSKMVSLTDAQKTQLQPYLDAMQPQLDAIHRRARQSENLLLKQLYSSIRTLLTPEQQTKLDALEVTRAAAPPPTPAGVELKFGEGFGSVSQ